jgi:sugar-specific transcriptional regulator TrmB
MDINHLKAIENLGLSEKEARVYLALLELGRASAFSISLKSTLKRPTTYVILEQLMQKGFALKIPRARKHAFQAVPPEKCFSLASERLNFTADLLPELKALQKETEEKTSISYFKGVDGFKEAYDRILKNKREITSVAFYAHQENVPLELRKFWDELGRKFAGQKIIQKVIIPHDASVNEFLSQVAVGNNKIHLKALLADKFSSDVSIEIYGDMTLLASHKYMQASLIQDADVAQTMAQLFGLVWDLVEKDKEHYVGFSTDDKK